MLTRLSGLLRASLASSPDEHVRLDAEPEDRPVRDAVAAVHRTGCRPMSPELRDGTTPSVGSSHVRTVDEAFREG